MLTKVIRAIFILVLIGYLFSLGSVYFSYVEPYLFPLRLIQGEARYITENIIVGPYPREKDIDKLVRVSKVEVFISLLNPSIPFEKSLIEKEKEILQRYEVNFYNVPLSFIDLGSKENLKKLSRIKELIEKHQGKKIYIHCYLGRHRVGIVAERLLGVVK